MKIKPSIVWKEFAEFYTAAWQANKYLTITLSVLMIVGMIDEIRLFPKGWGLLYQLIEGIGPLFEAVVRLIKQIGG